jgi:hypothetical protein
LITRKRRKPTGVEVEFADGPRLRFGRSSSWGWSGSRSRRLTRL